MKLGSLVFAVLVAGAGFAAQGEEKTAQEAAMEARLRSLFTVSPDWYIPKSVDPQNDKVRLLLLAPGGPLLIEAELRESGRPYAAFLEEQIDLLFKSADRDGDGKLSWKTEAVGMRLPTHRLALKEKEQKVWLGALDLDQDGFASRYELRRLLCLDGANTLLVVGSPQGSPLTAEACFQQLADPNGDGTLSADELDGLEKRLRLRDANDNELIDSYELLGAKVDAYRTGRRASAVALVWLHEETDWERLQKQLATSYAAQGSLGTGEPRLALLTAAVDGNADHSVDAAELRSLLTVEPQIHLEVNLGENDSKPQGAWFRSVSNSLREISTLSPLPDNKKETLLESAGLRLAVSGNLPSPLDKLAREPFDSIARSYMKRYDKDQNGYLDEKEAVPPLSLADANGDKKVVEEEITAFFASRRLFDSRRLYVTAANEPKPLLKLVDTNNDGLLSLRELGKGKQRLLTLDANQNGQIDPDEWSGLLRIAFTQGKNPNENRARGNNFLIRGMNPPQVFPWFEQMDVNGDADISQREFLGTPEQFQALDSNGDGLLSKEEAGKAK